MRVRGEGIDLAPVVAVAAKLFVPQSSRTVFTVSIQRLLKTGFAFHLSWIQQTNCFEKSPA